MNNIYISLFMLFIIFMNCIVIFNISRTTKNMRRCDELNKQIIEKSKSRRP